MEMDLDKIIEYKIQSTYKICFIGEKEVGKTSLIMRFLNNNYNNKYFPTKKLRIYETFHNFNSDALELDKYSCIELLDT